VRSFTNKQIELVANFVKQPAAVTLDIMKPDFDGWTVLMRRLLEKIAALKPH
jgi:CheY-like chemotaxis protein